MKNGGKTAIRIANIENEWRQEKERRWNSEERKQNGKLSRAARRKVTQWIRLHLKSATAKAAGNGSKNRDNSENLALWRSFKLSFFSSRRIRFYGVFVLLALLISSRVCLVSLFSFLYFSKRWKNTLARRYHPFVSPIWRFHCSSSKFSKHIYVWKGKSRVSCHFFYSISSHFQKSCFSLPLCMWKCRCSVRILFGSLLKKLKIN